MSRVSESFAALRTATAAVRAMRAPLLIALLAYFVLSNPAQVLELYLILARSPDDLWPQIALAALSLAAVAFFLTYAGRALARAADDVSVAPGERSSQATVFHILPVAIGLLPLVGCALGLWRAWTTSLTEVALAAVNTIKGFKTPELLDAAAHKVAAIDPAINAQELLAHAQQINNRLDLTVAPAILALPKNAETLSVAIGTGMAICGLIGAVLVAVFGRKNHLAAFEPSNRAFHPAITSVIGAIFVVLLGLITAQFLNAGGDPGFDFTEIPRQLGTLALVNISLLSLIYVTCLATRWSDKHKIPLVMPLLVGAAIISMHNWNDNHGVRLITSSADQLASRKLTPDGRATPTLVEAFDAWIKARPTDYVQKFAGKPYPIYVVAAQGGGMYAASLSGLALARLYDRCPALRHHVFAISGVSGGSVGSGYFAALLREAGPDALRDDCTMTTPHGGFGPLETQMEHLLQADLLAPVSASFLFPDLLQRFIPYPIPAFDRARAFEAGVEQAWASRVSSTKANPLREAFWRHWRADGSVPMLFLNTTVADTGQQVPVAPVNFSETQSTFVTDMRTLRERAAIPDTQDVPLSTAMSLSARFPLVMPAGLIETDSKTLRVVDGGYYENSGVDTATEIIDRIAGTICSSENYSSCKGRYSREKEHYAFRMIVLTDYDPFREVHAMSAESPEGGLNEVMSPLRAMLNARVARGELIVGKLQPFSKYGSIAPRYIATTKITLNHRIYGLPLGWQLSRTVQDVISAQVGEPDTCVRAGTPDFFGTIIQVMRLERGFEYVAAEREGREPRHPDATHGTPFVELLKTLQDNHCLLSDMLFADGVLPEMTAQSTPSTSPPPTP